MSRPADTVLILYPRSRRAATRVQPATYIAFSGDGDNVVILGVMCASCSGEMSCLGAVFTLPTDIYSSTLNMATKRRELPT
jgi:hypothetical protein